MVLLIILVILKWHHIEHGRYFSNFYYSFPVRTANQKRLLVEYFVCLQIPDLCSFIKKVCMFDCVWYIAKHNGCLVYSNSLQNSVNKMSLTEWTWRESVKNWWTGRRQLCYFCFDMWCIQASVFTLVMWACLGSGQLGRSISVQFRISSLPFSWTWYTSKSLHWIEWWLWWYYPFNRVQLMAILWARSFHLFRSFTISLSCSMLWLVSSNRFL